MKIQFALILAILEMLGVMPAFGNYPAPPPYENVFPSRHPFMSLDKALVIGQNALRPSGTNHYCIQSRIQTQWTDKVNQYETNWWLQYASTSDNHLYNVWIYRDGRITVQELAPIDDEYKSYYPTNTEFWGSINRKRNNQDQKANTNLEPISGSQ